VLWFVHCPCGLRGPLGYLENDAVKSWNRIRVDRDDVLDALMERQNDMRTNKGA